MERIAEALPERDCSRYASSLPSEAEMIVARREAIRVADGHQRYSRHERDEHDDTDASSL